MIRILIVDDADAIREGLQSLLNREPDFEVIGTARDGPEALVMGLELLPHVVVMDAQMPGMDGVEVTKHLKETSSDIGVLLLSVFMDYMERGVTAGADGCLLKDCEPQELYSQVRRIGAKYQKQGI